MNLILRCQERGCRRPAILCRMPGEAVLLSASFRLCPSHAVADGFCGSCGAFIGTDELGAEGICDGCRHNLVIGAVRREAKR